MCVCGFCLRRVPVSPSLQHGRTCLHLASIHGHFDTVLAILQSGLVDINAASKVRSVMAELPGFMSRLCFGGKESSEKCSWLTEH